MKRSRLQATVLLRALKSRHNPWVDQMPNTKRLLIRSLCSAKTLKFQMRVIRAHRRHLHWKMASPGQLAVYVFKFYPYTPFCHHHMVWGPYYLSPSWKVFSELQAVLWYLSSGSYDTNTLNSVFCLIGLRVSPKQNYSIFFTKEQTNKQQQQPETQPGTLPS